MKLWLSRELSWFGQGVLPEPIAQWHKNLDAPARAKKAREDRYFIGEASETLGLKWRDGAIEVKERLSVEEPLSSSSGWDAPLEAWRKWSFPLVHEDIRPEDGWLAVGKRSDGARWFFDETGGAAGEDTFTFRCEVAVQHLEIGGGPYWRLAVEAGGASLPPTPVLRDTVQRAFETAPPRPDGVLALAFPAFLKGLPSPTRPQAPRGR